MASPAQPHSKTTEVELSPRDILFECPSCRKSLVVDEAAEGLIVQCPQCQIDVIVPPKSQKPAFPAPVQTAAPPPASTPAQPPPAPAPAQTATSAPATSAPAGGDARLAALANKLKELQTQRAEINNRLAARMNDINRDLVLMARLETAHRQVLDEFNQLISQKPGP